MIHLVHVYYCEGVEYLSLLDGDCCFCQSILDCVHVIEPILVVSLDCMFFYERAKRSSLIKINILFPCLQKLVREVALIIFICDCYSSVSSIMGLISI